MVYQKVLKNAKYCPQCNGDTLVTDSRPNNYAIGLVRSRKCKACGHRFTTIEITTAEFYELINKGGPNDSARTRGNDSVQ